MSAIINGTTFGDTPSFTAGSKWVEGQPVQGIIANQIEDVTAPGADWSIQKDYGRRQQVWSCSVAFCESTPAACVSTAQTFCEGLTPGRFGCTFAGVSVAGCRGESFSPGVPFCVPGAAVMIVAITISRNA